MATLWVSLILISHTPRRDAVGGERVKRILESSDSSSSNSGGEEEKGEVSVKIAKMDNPTVF